MYCITRALRDGGCRGACAFVQLGPLSRVPVSGARPRVSKDVNVDVLRVSWIYREGSIRRGWTSVGCGEMGACTSHPARKLPLCMCSTARFPGQCTLNKFEYYLNSCFARGYGCTVVRPIDETGEGCGPQKKLSMWHEMKKAVTKIDH
jgi:hypothetical protein